MSNRPSKLKAKDIQVGNFIVSREGTGNLQFIKVRNVYNTWNMKWRSDTEFFMLIEEMLKQEGHIYFKSFISMCYMMANGVKDKIFMEGLASLWKEQNDRFTAQKSDISEEENQQIINEEREKHNG